MPNFISEDQIEGALLQKLQHVHGYDVLNCHTQEREDLADGSGRTSKREVILLDRLRAAAIALKLERQFATELEVIKRDGRLDTIAEDIVRHFPARGYLGKGMVISVDKFTAVKMFDKVERLWKTEIRLLTGRGSKAATESEKAILKRKLEWMKRVEMAVVISEEADEEKKFAKQKLEIARHRKRMNALDAQGHDIETNFKDPEHPLQLVFLCAMWLTGFDAPTVSTLYLDKGRPKVLVQEWFKDTQSKKRVASVVEEILHANLPASYDRALFKVKCDDVFGLVLDHASHGRKWAA